MKMLSYRPRISLLRHKLLFVRHVAWWQGFVAFGYIGWLMLDVQVSHIP